MRSLSNKRQPSLKLLTTLFLAIVHLTTGFLILLVASWFIAASSIAGVGFNYMLPAVVIRALALLRIGSGYFSMLVGHNHLLDKLALLRLEIFSNLENKVSVSRQHSLDALHNQSEEVASIWIAWVGQNAGMFLSLLAINLVSIIFIPELSDVMLSFTVLYLCIYGVLLIVMANKSVELVDAKQQAQFAIVQHIEAAPVWHLYNNYDAQMPTLRSLQNIANSLQVRIRIATLTLFIAAIVMLTMLLSLYSQPLTGNALFIIVPIALLSINDWLMPSFGNQKQLLSYFNAKHAIQKTDQNIAHLHSFDDVINGFELIDFKPVNTHMPRTTASFEPNSISVIMGSSGAGKSRMLQALAGLLGYEGHRIPSAEQDSDKSEDLSSQALLAGCLYVEQFPYVLSDTLRANLLIANSKVTDGHLFRILKQVGLEQLDDLDLWLGDNGRPLSGGEKKRLGLARALLTNRNVLLLDEPFEALDEHNIKNATDIINRLASNKTLVLATHIFPADLACQQCISIDTASDSTQVPSVFVTSLLK